ncbi:MAG: SOS response-associated peptidase [Bacteroidia bacterium]|nr:SOS response-associated peptidase [Bacteroidia bacterium]
MNDIHLPSTQTRWPSVFRRLGASYKPRYNAGPTQLLPIILSSSPQGISTFFWGTSPEWSKNKTPSEKVINVRAENLKDKPAFRRAITKHGALFLPTVFTRGKSRKKTTIPYRFVLADKEPFAIAGLWEEFEDENGEAVHTFMMFTVPANSLVSLVHDRMPAILERDREEQWLAADLAESALSQALTPYSSALMNMYTVSPRINALQNDFPSLVIPAPPADQHGNLTLFD